MTGLAPEIPEDLYMLIKKVASSSLPYSLLLLFSIKRWKLALTYGRPSRSANTSRRTVKTRTVNSASF